MGNKIITSVNNEEIKTLAKIAGNPSDEIVVEGYHMVEEAVRAGLAKRIYSVKDYRTSLPFTAVSEGVLRKVCRSKTPEGIFALADKPVAKPVASDRVLLLDRVQDPGNLGTLIRTALSFGFMDVLAIEGTAKAFSGKALMASQGACFHLNIVEGLSEERALDLLEGRTLLSAELNGEPFSEAPRDIGRLAVVLGNEGRGISRSLLERSGLRVRIEMDNLDSLNVAVAGGIIMYAYRGVENFPNRK